MQLVTPAKPRPRLAWLRALLGTALFGAAFLGAAAVVEGVATPDIEVLPNKLREFSRVPGRYNLAFIGSSHVYHQIDPSVFDAVCAEHGLDIHSFNLGLPGWATLQLSYMVRQALGAGQPLEYLIIDAEYVQLEINPANIRVQQTIAWHDLPTTVLVARTLMATKPDIKRAWQIASLHTLPFLYHMAAFGQLQTPLMNWVRGVTAETLERQRQVSNGPHGDGFRDYTNMLATSDPVTRKALVELQKEMQSPAGRARHQKEVQALRVGTRVTGTPKPETRVAVGELQRLADAAGVRAMFVTSPVLFTAYAETQKAQQAGVIDTLLFFTDANEFPQLYAHENQFDNRHLNAKGAAIFSRLMAERFVESVKKGGAGRPAP